MSCASSLIDYVLTIVAGSIPSSPGLDEQQDTRAVQDTEYGNPRQPVQRLDVTGCLNRQKFDLDLEG